MSSYSVIKEIMFNLILFILIQFTVVNLLITVIEVKMIICLTLPGTDFLQAFN